LVVVQNPASVDSRHTFANLKLPHKNFKAQKWNSVSFKFEDMPSDLFEQHHFNYEQKEFIDFEMVVPGPYSTGELTLLKVISIEDAEREEIQKKEAKAKQLAQADESPISLTVLGIGPSNDILFQYKNKD